MTKCVQCGSVAMTRRRESVPYETWTLPGVTLVGVDVWRCGACGEVYTSIPGIEDLHRVLARAVLESPGRLAGGEVRFLRGILGLMAADLARIMGVSASQVSRWENGREPIGPQADRLLRLMVAQEQGAVLPFANLTHIGRAGRLQLDIRFDAARKTWRVVAPRAAATRAKRAA